MFFKANSFQGENLNWEEKCKSLQLEKSLHSTTEAQLVEYKEQVNEMQVMVG